MKRREFLTTAGTAALALTLDTTQNIAQSPAPATSATESATPAYVILGVPLRAGSLYPGTENDAQAYRDADLLKHLNNSGCHAIDAGDLAIPSFLPHHSVPPIRNWPSPRIVWDILNDRKLTSTLKQPGQIPLLIGCDCSVVVGTAQALRNATSTNFHVIYIDGDFDDSAPISSRSQSAASCAVWFLTHDSPFWTGPRTPNPPRSLSSEQEMRAAQKMRLAPHNRTYSPHPHCPSPKSAASEPIKPPSRFSPPSRPPQQSFSTSISMSSAAATSLPSTSPTKKASPSKKEPNSSEHSCKTAASASSRSANTPPSATSIKAPSASSSNSLPANSPNSREAEPDAGKCHLRASPVSQAGSRQPHSQQLRSLIR